MKKLGSLFRQTLENRIREQLKSSESVFVISYSKISSPDLSSLRLSLRASQSRLFVSKNSIARRALKEAGLGDLEKTVQGQCGLVFMKDEPVEASKIICNFIKDHEHLKLQIGLLKDRILKTQDIETLAKLPSKEVLRAKVVGAMKSPIVGIVCVFNQTLKKFVYCLEQIKNKKAG